MSSIANPSRKLILVTGPARSGKSEWAEILATQSGKSVVYIATAQIDLADLEWQTRIAKHQQRRPSEWITWQVPIALSDALRQGQPEQCLLIDSLGTWLANFLEDEDEIWYQTCSNLLPSLEQTVSDVILVAEETGWGVVPAYPAGRQFRDRLGQLTRQIGAIADPVYLVTGGHVLNLSRLGLPLDQAAQNTNGHSE
jgi:adenosylcobinamide kinase / adenosylcobinamide-phosphate guanylyltransferase